jgi:hypothetical protein
MPIVTRIERQTFLFLGRPDGDPPSNGLRDPSNIGLLLQVGGSVAVVYYALGWLFMMRLLLPFDVSPEEIGVTPTWILFRMMLVVYPSIIAIASLLLLNLAKSHWPTAAYRILQLAMLVLVLMFTAFGIATPSTGLITDVLYALLVLSSIGLLFSINLWWSRRTGRPRWILIASAICWVLISGLYLWNVAAERANRISLGEIDVTFGRIPVLHTPRVTGFELRGDGVPKQLFACGTLLGSANGATIVLAGSPGEYDVLRFPTEQLALQHGCSSSEDS